MGAVGGGELVHGVEEDADGAFRGGQSQEGTEVGDEAVEVRRNVLVKGAVEVEPDLDADAGDKRDDARTVRRGSEEAEDHQRIRRRLVVAQPVPRLITTDRARS